MLTVLIVGAATFVAVASALLLLFEGRDQLDDKPPEARGPEPVQAIAEAAVASVAPVRLRDTRGRFVSSSALPVVPVVVTDSDGNRWLRIAGRADIDPVLLGRAS